MSAARAAEIAAGFDLRALPADFLANPYPVYALLRETDPVRQLPDGSYFLTRHSDLMAVYRDAQTFSSDKKVEFQHFVQVMDACQKAGVSNIGIAADTPN